ncbi:hypothetical protein BH20ACI1_BH20ACI1_12160 [soil metagenome]
MLLQKIRLRGFLGHRGISGADGKADFAEFDFNDSSLWLIHGENGGGKSSLWDALTFAFFKQHRGSGRENSKSFKFLIHEKETDIAEIEVEFELDSQTYRICGEIGKTKRGGATANRVLYKLNEDDAEVFQDGDKKVQAWLSENLPFSFETFTSAILLRQGEADVFLKARAAERKQILLKLLRLDFYEKLRVSGTQENNKQKGKVTKLTEKLTDLPNPSDEEVNLQNELVKTTKAELEKLGEQQKEKQIELTNAKDAEKYHGEIAKIEEQKSSDAELFAKAELIEKNVARFRELEKTLPLLENLWQNKNDLTEEFKNWSKSQDNVCEIKSELKKLDSIEEAKQTVKGFKRNRNEKQTAKNELIDKLSKCEIELTSLNQNLKNRNKITGKAECPFCGSELNSHSQRLQEEIESWESEIKKIEEEKENLVRKLGEAKKGFEQAEKDFQKSDENLGNLEKRQIEITVKLEAEKGKCEDLKLRVENFEVKVANCHQQIPSDWQEDKSIDDEIVLKELKNEKDKLRLAEADADKLRQAADREKEFKGELKRLQKQLDEIPLEHQRIAAEVREELAKISGQIDLKNTENEQANRKVEEMQQQKVEYENLAAEQKEEGRKSRLWGKLADALGKKGLQSQIVQSAQEKVKILANDTLNKLTDGNFEIELEDIAETEELNIYVRDWRTESLRLFELFSGGERLLLAVSLAVAVGQAAHGKNAANTLIIDEGFGALDDKNRNLMTTELTRLSDVLEGARVIVVSHQNDVINKFPNRYQIGKNKEGFSEIIRN